MTPDEALSAWGGGSARLIGARENAVYAALLPDGRRVALRLHRPGYQSLAAIRSELTWTAALATWGEPVPAPVPTLTGEMVHAMPGGGAASAVAWLSGAPLGHAYQPLSGSPEALAARFRAIGAALAGLHEATDRFAPPGGFIRPAWDTRGLLGDAPLWGRFWENPALDADERAVLISARDAMRPLLDRFRAAGADYGLIHADLMRENVLFDGGRVAFIDFDDCGWGFRLYDLGTLMIQNLDEPAYPLLAEAALDGYASRRALPLSAARLLPLFVALRCFASCGWAVPRMAAGDGKLRFYAERAVKAAQEVLAVLPPA